MAESYTGTKIRTVFAHKDPPRDERLDELIHWCRRFSELGLAPNGAGNLSLRTAEGFIITPTGANLGLVKKESFVEVLRVDLERREVTAAGAHEPSSETMMHGAIYGARPDVKAVLHGHHDRLVGAAEDLGIAVTAAEKPYGTREVVDEVLKVLEKQPFLVIRNHGFVALGTTLTEAGRLTEAVLAKFLSRSG
jgi:L-fuculose-phosphate aldolase